MDNEFSNNLFNNLMDTWILPSVRERQEKGELAKPLSLRMAQIIFKPEGGKPEVRINTEVRGRAIIKLNEKLEKPIEKGDPVSINQIDNIEAFELENDDSNYGHATIISASEKWLISFNFIYNKQSSQEHLQAAKEFLFAANASLQNAYHRACLDSLHSASELAAKAYLLGRPDKSIIHAKSHDVVHSQINIERKLGNVPEGHVDTFNNLRNLRSSARYLQSDIQVSSEQIEGMRKDVEDFINEVSKYSESKL